MPRKAKEATPASAVYKLGYVVYLRSGGPEMVIESIEENGDLNCVWFTVTYDGKWEMPCRSRFIAPSVQLAADGDLVDSERGIPWDIHSRASPPIDEETELQTRVRSRTEAKAAIADAKAGKLKPKPPPEPLPPPPPSDKRRRY